MTEDWSSQEVTLIVADYFSMLDKDLRYQPYNKTAHRQALLPLLAQRSNGSIEFKHQNISAVLADQGIPFIKGYKPRGNYQQLLFEKVIQYIERHEPDLDPLFEEFVKEAIPEGPVQPADFESCLESPPLLRERESFAPKRPPTFRPSKPPYLEREQRNRILGAEGEQFVMDYERWRLTTAQKPHLAKDIVWTAKDKGDGTGYDILSKNTDGTDRYIEVKTTKMPKETPIYVTANEIAFAAKHPDNFYLYRVFNAGAQKKLFIRSGSYAQICVLEPITFKGLF